MRKRGGPWMHLFLEDRSTLSGCRNVRPAVRSLKLAARSTAGCDVLHRFSRLPRMEEILSISNAGAGALVMLALFPRLVMAQSQLDSVQATAAVERFHRALETGDSSVALTLLADDANILESGGLESRTEYRHHHLPGDIAFAKAVPSRRSVVNVKVEGNAAWIVSTAITRGEFRGRAVDMEGAELMVLSRTPAGWRIRAIHWSGRPRQGSK